MHLRGNTSTLRGTAGAVLAAALLAAVPAGADAKTFKARFSDPKGDAKPAARDITAGRVAYNRKTGALSASVTVAEDFAEERDDAVVVLVVSDLVKGRCRAVRLTMGVALSDPAVPIAWKGEKSTGNDKLGAGSIEGNTLNMRVKAKAFSGLTPGCTAFFIVDESQELIDDTPIENGFA